MKRVIRELTKEKYIQATEYRNAAGIFTPQEVMGYGVYNERYYEKDGKYFVSFNLGDGCD